MQAVISAIVLGILQGLTEFLPVSSTAHLILLPWALNWNDPLLSSLNFDVALHLGTLVAVVAYFRNDWAALIRAFFSSIAKKKAETADERVIWLILIATVPGAVLGKLFEQDVETVFRNPLLIASTLFVVAIIMMLAERYAAKREGMGMDEMKLPHAVAIGFAQACALLPGVSRSGATITAGLFAGYTRESAARFSFLLSTPIIAGACLLKAGKLIEGFRMGEGTVIVAGVAASAVSGYLAIAFLINYLKKHPLDVFAWYRIALACAVSALYFFK
ncbi:MAG TPA: undecaprenyl-diphosphatase UppP [Nitrospirota bacterium]